MVARTRTSPLPKRTPRRVSPGRVVLSESPTAWPVQTWRQGQIYPDMPKVASPGEARQPDMTTIGAPGVTIMNGILDPASVGEFNPDFGWLKGIEIYDMMRRNDAQIQALEHMVTMPFHRAKWTIKPGGDDAKSKEIAAFIESALFHDMSWVSEAGNTFHQNWSEILRHILLHLFYGFSTMEICWKKEDGWVKWSRWMPIMQRTLYKWWVDNGNDLTGIEVYTWKNNRKEYLDIPIGKLLHFVHKQEGNNPEGMAGLRAVYKHWYYKDRYYAIEAVAIERSAVAPPVFTHGPNPTANDIARAQDLVQNVRVNERMGVSILNGETLEILRGGQKQAEQTQPAIEHHDIQIARAFLVQFLNLGSKEVGSYALAQGQIQMFLAAYQAVASYIAEIINPEIRRLVDWNYTGVEVYPTLQCSKLIAQDFETLTKAWQALNAGNAPLLQPSPEIAEFMLEELGLPQSVSGTQPTTNPSAPTTPERPDTAPQDHATQAAPPPQLSEALDEARLLREAMMTLDAVEKSYVFFNPLHEPPGSPIGGHFAPRGGGAGGGGEGHVSRGSGRHGMAGVTHTGHHEEGHSGGGERDTSTTAGRAAFEHAYNPHGAISLRAMHEDSGQGMSKTLHKMSATGLKAAVARHNAEHPDEVITVKGKSKDAYLQAIHEHFGVRNEAEGKGGGAPKASGKSESIHERSARLQKEGGLKAEVKPATGIDLTHLTPEPSAANVHIERNERPSLSKIKAIYGEHQLGAALTEYSTPSLREMASAEGVNLKGAGANKGEIISRLTTHATEGRYSANFGAPHASGTKASGKEEERTLRARIATAKRDHQSVPVNGHTKSDLISNHATGHIGKYAHLVQSDPYSEASMHSLYQGLHRNPAEMTHALGHEARGVLGLVARNNGIALTGREDGPTLARMIAEHVHQQENPEMSAHVAQSAHNQALKAEAEVRESAPLKGTRGESAHDAIQRDMGRTVAPKASGTKAGDKSAAARTKELHATAKRIQGDRDLEREKQPGETLTLRHVDPEHHIDLRNGIEAPWKAQIYGEDQLGLALHAHSTGALRQEAEKLGISTKGIATDHDALVSHITAHVTEGRYSANFRASKGEAEASGKQGSATKATKPAADTISRSAHEKLQAAHEKLKAEHEELKRQVTDMQRQMKAQGAGKAKSAGGTRGSKGKEIATHLVTRLSNSGDPVEAWHNLGGTRATVRAALEKESPGRLRMLLQHRNMPSGPEPRYQTSKSMARSITDRLASVLESGGEA